MSKFLVRAGLSYSYAFENYDKEGALMLSLSDRLAAKCKEELLTYRFTFGVFRVEAENAADCEAKVLQAWEETCPGAGKELTVLIVPDEENDRADLMRSVYANFYGVEPYQRLTTDLYGQITMLTERGGLAAMRRQNYLFAMDGGCGFTTLISSFGDYLRRMGAFEERGEKLNKYCEYILDKETAGERTSPEDLLEQLKNDTEDCNIIGIDLGAFIEGGKADELRRLARLLYPLQDDLVFVFRVPFLEKKALDEIANTLSDLMLLRVVAFPPLHDAVLLETLWDGVRTYGYCCDHELAEVFFTRIRREKKDGRFYGFKTALKVVQEIVMAKALSDYEAQSSGGKPDKTRIVPGDLPQVKEEKKNSGYDALSELVGMEEITERVREIVAQVKMSINNKKLDRPCIHMRFLGAPGTGKTTVARIIGQIFREEGILRKGAFMEYTSRELCAEYVGQTAVKTAAICRDAYGSVLFIDEAYALYQDDRQINDYGKEALTTLISEMENHRDDMLVIMAGYTDDMETLMKGNAGLRSRMPYALEFKSYSRKQLFEIFMQMVSKHFDYTPELERAARDYFTSLPDAYVSSKEFANARFVRNLYERTWSKGALRASLAGVSEITLGREDFFAASSEKEFGEKLEQKARSIGF